MSKIILLFWVLTSGGDITEPQRIEGWQSIEECRVAADSLTASQPKERLTHGYAVVAQCLRVPK